MRGCLWGGGVRGGELFTVITGKHSHMQQKVDAAQQYIELLSNRKQTFSSLLL